MGEGWCIFPHSTRSYFHHVSITLFLNSVNLQRYIIRYQGWSTSSCTSERGQVALCAHTSIWCNDDVTSLSVAVVALFVLFSRHPKKIHVLWKRFSFYDNIKSFRFWDGLKIKWCGGMGGCCFFPSFFHLVPLLVLLLPSYYSLCEAIWYFGRRCIVDWYIMCKKPTKFSWVIIILYFIFLPLDCTMFRVHEYLFGYRCCAGSYPNKLSRYEATTMIVPNHKANKLVNFHVQRLKMQHGYPWLVAYLGSKICRHPFHPYANTKLH